MNWNKWLFILVYFIFKIEWSKIITFMIKFILILVCILMVNDAFTQETKSKYPSTIVIDQDTVIVFSFEQGKQLSKINEERKYCLQNQQLVELQLSHKDSIILGMSQQIENHKLIETSYQEIFRQKESLSKICESENADLAKQVRVQKRHKIFVLIGGFLSSSILTYFYITK